MRPRSDPHDEPAVLIAGAGPAGLAAAIELGRRGIAPLVVERRRAGFEHPRATSISTGSMELLRAWGLEADVLAGGVDVEWTGWEGDTLTGAGAEVALGLPSRQQSTLVSPTGPACVPQDHLEPALLRHAASLGARIERGTRLVDVALRPDAVDAVLRDAAGSVRTVRARYLVGADGAYSTVRELLGIAMRGRGEVVTGVSTLFRAPLWRRLGGRRHGVYSISHPEGRGVVLPAGPGDRWLYGYADAATRLPERPGTATVTRRLRLATGVADLEPRIERIGRFVAAAGLADSFRAGRAFLAGDAAHRVTPRGGTGLNTALRDGHDLGWKLAWALLGWATPDLLDSYEAERRPVAEHNVARSVDPNGSAREVVDELHVDLGGRIPHLWVGSGRARRSTLDLLGPGVTRFSGPVTSPQHGPRDRAPGAPVTEHRLPAITARALGVAPHGALLVRPDGVPLHAAPAAQLAAA